MKYFLLFLGLISQFILANEFSQSTLVSTELTAYNYYPDIEVDESGTIYIVWVNSHQGGDVHFAMSNDHGQTFTHLSRVNHVLNQATTIGFSGPQIEVLNDTIHVLWTDQRSGYSHTSAYYARSIDQGISWEESQIGHPNGVNFYPELMIDSEGIIHASFHYYQSGSFDYHHIAHTFSSDGGETWSEYSNVSDYEIGEPCDCCPIELHELPNGKIIHGFRNNNENIRDMFSTEWKSEDSTWINLAPLSYDNYFVDFCPSSGPSMVSLDSTVAMAYMAGLNGDTRVFLSLSDDLGDTFSVNIPLEISGQTDINQNHPSAVITDNGDIHMIWEDSRNGGNILYGKLEFGQTLFSDFSTVNDSATTFPEIAPKLARDSEGFLYAVWVDRRYGRQIHFSTTYPVPLSNQHKIIPDLFTLFEPYPNPFNPRTTIQFSIQSEISHAFALLQVLDINGRIVETLVNEKKEKGIHKIQWNASDYSSGVYFISLKIHENVKTVKTILLK
ncbi:MAG: T9SS type A sorting domain-containing protein [Candidatus Marinimicrobia bacterium]|jgi:hypothetical protein|nr:T9SS type A sorting domain-containing protein [Candidatus Neomarinimicrobiota bacterium]MBT3501035.1 T9SS type A sorting domain-containing protein [Candidatus Neomarinimicrobiota bacterium]MBT3838821.1 T9SS type A sorting domain-containing protein [Candidatus Neomarinimicrobiota bacterium]MBT3998798.1 T9SS type A sorting domain-containing protein [Candidatus Neomarinimicrobiota bacterium]MBT4282642.1 T9SS type A sorting domain-containing protein [Candidatus Neomarinimicrobiota bacterium]